MTSTPDYTEDDENVRRAKQHEMRKASDDEEKSQFYERVASSQRIPISWCCNFTHRIFQNSHLETHHHPDDMLPAPLVQIGVD
ncbi:unnamed protein product [Zymoseptoria tritici ST99CH_1A5]|uniref:Uncharacterized protein n=3 Tax=Zymoseptoria tritici TaxID=1047171 RepID=A0A1X7RMS7_ZYMT9|nr:unnamed protein product [Zymoseptoria tritici ST99CH_3D7]SMR48527.1 unnamed protein product [Zymoseptoria tritici ST99CH_1E4]SMR49710.1 unnamed protein product [Zymoseptoria tritici ST99CH_3D1]SMY22407.1 unnamed protein product [Zymoseptoria tritici ST99CH_1A5]